MPSPPRLLRDIAVATGFRYPLGWAGHETILGDYEGRGVTIEVFNIRAREQRRFFLDLREALARIQPNLLASVTFVFHTPEATADYYGHLFPQLRRAELTGTLVIDLGPGGVGPRPQVTGNLHVALERAA